MSKPIKAVREKGIDVAMWTTRNGGYAFTFRKTYKDKASGEYKETKNFFKEELEILRKLIDEAITWGSPTQQQEDDFFKMIEND